MWQVLPALPLVVALGVALHAASLKIGFVGDDYIHQFILEGAWDHPSLRPWSLYDFGTHSQSTSSVWWEAGVLPWWTQAEWKLRFFRPLTSLTIWLDHALFGTWAPGYKLTSLIWYTALLLLVHALYRAWGLSRPTALLAVFLFAVAECSIMPVGWVANRNSLLAVFFTAASLLALARHPRWGAVPAFVSALVLACLACLSKESGIAAFALIVLYVRWPRAVPGPWPGRGLIRAATAAGALSAAGYVLFLAASGYGAKSLYYPSPWEDPGELLWRICTVLPAGICHVLGPFTMRPLLSRVYLALPLALVLGGILWKELRRTPAAAFFAAWIILTALPQAAGKPSDRLLFGPAVGGAALLAMFVTSIRARPSTGSARWLYRILAATVLFYAGGLEGWRLVDGWQDYARAASGKRQVLTTAEVGSPRLGRREVFMLQSPHTGVALAPITTWSIETGDGDVRFWPLQMGRRAVRWSRLDERSFELEALDGPFLTRGLEELFMVARLEPVPGTKWETALFTVEAVAFGQDGLRRFRVRCPESIDQPRYRFLTFRGGRFVSVPPPPAGQSVILPAVVR